MQDGRTERTGSRLSDAGSGSSLWTLSPATRSMIASCPADGHQPHPHAGGFDHAEHRPHGGHQTPKRHPCGTHRPEPYGTGAVARFTLEKRCWNACAEGSNHAQEADYRRNIEEYRLLEQQPKAPSATPVCWHWTTGSTARVLSCAAWRRILTICCPPSSTLNGCASSSPHTDENKSVCGAHTRILEAVLHGTSSSSAMPSSEHLGRYKQSVAGSPAHPSGLYFIDGLPYQGVPPVGAAAMICPCKRPSGVKTPGGRFSCPGDLFPGLCLICVLYTRERQKTAKRPLPNLN